MKNEFSVSDNSNPLVAYRSEYRYGAYGIGFFQKIGKNGTQTLLDPKPDSFRFTNKCLTKSFGHFYFALCISSAVASATSKYQRDPNYD